MRKYKNHYILIAFIASMLVVIAALASEELTPTINGVVLCNSSPMTGADIDMGGCKSSMMIPVGTTGDRPATPLAGMVRWNSDGGVNSIEFYNGSIWAQMLPRSYNNTPSHSIQTVAASGNGFLVSSTRDYNVSYSTSISTTATIGGASSGYIVLEIAATNSSTASDWKEIGRLTNGQTITLAIALQSVQIIGGSLSGTVPAGYYTRLRSVNVSGTPTYNYISGQEVLL